MPNMSAAHGIRKGTTIQHGGGTTALVPPFRLIASLTTQMKKRGQEPEDSKKKKEEMPKGGSALLIFDKRIVIHRHHIGNGFVSAIVSRPGTARIGIVSAYNPPLGSVLNAGDQKEVWKALRRS